MLTSFEHMAVFIFRRDLRINDNTALLAALSNPSVKYILPVFIFTPEQIDPSLNKYFSHRAVQFMCESLQDLIEYQYPNFPLIMLKGDNITILQELFKLVPYEHIYFNKDNTVYSTKRDNSINEWCNKHNINCQYQNFEDYTLLPISDGLVPDSNKPYTVLAQFYKRYLKSLSIAKDIKILNSKLAKKLIPINLKKQIETKLRKYLVTTKDMESLYSPSNNAAMHGGRKHALEKRNRIKTLQSSYKTQRDFPAVNGTSMLSPYIKFGCVSIREVYWRCVDEFKIRDHPLIRELFFREFYTKIYAYNSNLQRTTSFLQRIENHLPSYTSKNSAYWKAWTTGTTGFPLVDAGMRQLLQTGFVHNRVRMVQASVATRYFNLDWRDCAQFYAQHLIDIDPIVNTASWQWCAGVGVDAMYYRAPFNPFIQSKKFDSQAQYIKKYVPELQHVPPNDIHKWYDQRINDKYKTVSYPHPIVDYTIASKQNVDMFKKAMKLA